jgi:hypothetical protein
MSDNVSNEIEKGLYDMTASVSIKPAGVINNMAQVELRIDDEFINFFPTYTQASEEVIRIVNQF